VKNSRQKKRKSYVRAIPSDEKDFLDPEAAFKTPLKPTKFPCGKEENKDNVETVSEDEDAMVPTKSCNGQRTKYDVYTGFEHVKELFILNWILRNTCPLPTLH